jgi:hypothetical protein
MSIEPAAPAIRHAIIAGANKCGTTSLFRYLGAHPGVRASRIKETGFFLSAAAERPDALQAYLQHFGPANARAEGLLLEATPHYLETGSRSARRIHSLLPGTQLIFLLRDPVDRFQSFYRSKQGFLDHQVSQLSSNEFVEQAFAEAATIEEDGPEEWRQAPFGRQLLKGRYAVYVRRFLEFFPADSVRILYFEDLRDQPRETVADACQFLGLDPAMYDHFEFAVENRSRRHRHPRLRTLASRTNRRLEPALNRIPWLRRAARTAYNAVNTSTAETVLSFAPADAQRLRAYYAPFNSDLSQLAIQLQLARGAPAWASAQ